LLVVVSFYIVFNYVFFLKVFVLRDNRNVKTRTKIYIFNLYCLDFQCLQRIDEIKYPIIENIVGIH
jgi:hypothetical protein